MFCKSFYVYFLYLRCNLLCNNSVYCVIIFRFHKCCYFQKQQTFGSVKCNNFCCFRFDLYLSYSHGKTTVAMCFGCIRNLYHNKMFSSQKLVNVTKKICQELCLIIYGSLILKGFYFS